MTGQEVEREAPGGPVAEKDHVPARSEDHPQLVARHSLQQAHPVPIERPAHQGRRLDRGARRRHRPAHAPAEPDRAPRCRRRGRGDRHVRDSRRRTTLPGARTPGEAKAPRPHRADSLRRSVPTVSPRRIRSPKIYSARHYIPSTSSAPSWRFAKRASARRKSRPPSSSRVQVVRQRLKLASVSQRLLEVYAEDGMTLDQLMAFTVNADHERQEQVWEGLQRSYAKEPYQIRRMLTEGAVRASDKRAQFVGVAAYEEAGGAVMRDLFQADDGGWLQDARPPRTVGRGEIGARGRNRSAPRDGAGSRSPPNFPMATPMVSAGSPARNCR